MHKKVLIIGAGLSGLLLAYRLKQKGVSVQIIEARNRLGGRIHTLSSLKNTPIEMGATWLGKQHQSLIAVLQELAIPVFPQFMAGKALFEPLSTAPPQEVNLPQNDSPSYRIQGGSSTIIKKLSSVLTEEEIILNTQVSAISFEKELVQITTSKGEFQGHIVVSTLPPNLFATKVRCTPSLPKEVIAIAKSTHTWMGESIKFGISYAQPFWKNKGFSGTIFSNVGPVTEVYDHTNFEERKFALKGFLNSGLSADTKEQREVKVLAQLTKLFGKDASDYLQYEECVWAQEKNTFVPYKNYVLPHQNNGHAVFQKSYFNNQLHFSGAETSSQFGGYMEGAVISIDNTLYKILKDHKTS